MDPSLTQAPWLDQPDAATQIAARVSAGTLSRAQAETLSSFARDGYATFGKLDDHDLCDRVAADAWDVVERYRGRPFDEFVHLFENLFKTSEATRALTVHPFVLECCDLVLGSRALPFQTLSLVQGTQIGAHADSILMSTRPVHHMVAAWIALEDVSASAGPLLVWPGSHRWPYVSPESIGILPTATREERQRIHNEHYYPRIREIIDGRGAEPVVYTPDKGEVLLWHSNLVHGGAPIERAEASRNSLVVHYFAESAEHHSDLFGDACVVPGLR